jgi:hypothetical protein
MASGYMNMYAEGEEQKQTNSQKTGLTNQGVEIVTSVTNIIMWGGA